jgi:flagellar biosynthetic protein FlhB
MAEEMPSQEDKSEEPSEDRRLKFREQGDVVQSKELTTMLSFFVIVAVSGMHLSSSLGDIERYFATSWSFQSHYAGYEEVVRKSVIIFLQIVIPIGAVAMVAPIFFTLVQTKFNFTLEKLQINFERLNPIQGLGKLFNKQSILDIFKNILKFVVILSAMAIVGFSERNRNSKIIFFHVFDSWAFMVHVIENMFYVSSGLLIVVGALDYFQNYFFLEEKMKMTKKEVKDEFKDKEVDPGVKGKMRRMQKEFSLGKTIEATKKATVLITNPTHFSIAIMYELGMRAPVVLAKGQDDFALRMRETAKDLGIPIVENKPLAQLIYRTIKINREIPVSLYKVMSEIISKAFEMRARNKR